MRTLAPAVLALGLVGGLTAPSDRLVGPPEHAGGPDVPRVVDLHVISGPTPFEDDCGDPGDQGTGIPGFEAEPHLSVHPHNPDHLLATWQQDRYSGIGGARSNLVAVSRDGGSSWSSPTTLPGISACTGGDRFRASDPWSAIGPDGVTYQASMAVTELATLEPRTNPAPLDFDGDIVVSTSTDGGNVWDGRLVVARDDGTDWGEKPVIVADPDTPGRAFVVWFEELLVDPSHVATPADTRMRFSRTDDGGRTWTEPAMIPPNVPGVPEAPWEIVVVPGDDVPTLVVIYTHFPQRVVFGPSVLAAVVSHDLGETWSLPVPVAMVPSPDQGVPTAAVGPDGTVHVAWWDPSPDGTSTILVAHSADRGVSWEVNEVVDLGTSAVDHGAVPTLAVAGDGTVGITWYDSRNDVEGDDEVTTDAFFGWSRDGGRTWRQRHVAGPFDLDEAAVTEGGRRFLGDYEGLVGFRHGFGALFSMARPQAQDGPTDIFFARIVLPSRGFS